MAMLATVPMLACLYLNECNDSRSRILQYSPPTNQDFTTLIVEHNIDYLTDHALDKLANDAGITNVKVRVRRREGHELLIFVVPFGGTHK